MCTIQAPHRPVPQPNLVPVSFNPSRITHNNGVAGGASVDAARPFTVKLVAILSSLSPRELRAVMNAEEHCDLPALAPREPGQSRCNLGTSANASGPRMARPRSLAVHVCSVRQRLGPHLDLNGARL